MNREGACLTASLSPRLGPLATLGFYVASLAQTLEALSEQGVTILTKHPGSAGAACLATRGRARLPILRAVTRMSPGHAPALRCETGT